MRINCSCGKTLSVDDKLVGKRVRCPACGEVLTVQSNAASPSPRPGRNVPPPEEDGEEEPERRPRKKMKRKKRAASAAWVWWAAGGVGLLVASVLVAVLVLSNRATKEPPQASRGDQQVAGTPQAAAPGPGTRIPPGTPTGNPVVNPGATTLAFYKGVTQLALAENGAQLATCRDNVIKVWELPSGRELNTLEQGHASDWLAYSSSGRWLGSVTKMGLEGELKIWDMKEYKLKQTARLARSGKLAFSPDDQFAFVGAINRGIEVIDIATGKVTATLAHENMPPGCIAFSSKKAVAATQAVPEGRPIQRIQFYDLTDRTYKFEIITPPNTRLQELAFSGDGHKLVAVTSNKLFIIRWEEKPAVWQAIGVSRHQWTPALALSPDGKFVFDLSRGSFTIWNFAAGGSAFTPTPFGATAIALNSVTNELYIASRDGPVRIDNRATGDSRTAGTGDR